MGAKNSTVKNSEVQRLSRMRFYTVMSLRVQSSPPPPALILWAICRSGINVPEECVMDLRIILGIMIEIRLTYAHNVFVRLLSN